MNRSLFSLVLLFLAVIATASCHNFDSSLDDMWSMWKLREGRSYENDEEHQRRSIWENNVAFINRHNLETSMGVHTYTVGLNHFADFTPEEYARFLGYRSSARSEKEPLTFLSPLSISIDDLPAKVDWRDQGYVTPVKNQLQCGSCWAFSTTGSLEGQYYRKYHKLVSFSEQQLVDCSTDHDNDGCSGGLMDNAFQYVIDISKKGQFLETEDCYPYTARDQKCHINLDKKCFGTTCSSYVDIKHNNETDLMVAVATVGPVSVAIDAAHQSFQLYKEGVYNEPHCSPTELDHGVLAVGYGSENGKDYWLVKNSWGTKWGIDGYVKMARNQNNQCGIATEASYPLI